MLKEKGWLVAEDDKSSSKDDPLGENQYPSGKALNATIIQHELMEHLEQLDLKEKHHRSFKPTEMTRLVHTGTTSNVITGYGKRILPRLLNGGGSRKIDLVLDNVQVIEGFHVNIISERKLHEKTKAWFCGHDCSLRYGSPDSSVILKKCIAKGYIAFIELKHTSTYYKAPLLRNLIPFDLRSFLAASANFYTSSKFKQGFNGSKYLLILKDDFSRWILAIPVKTRSHGELFNALYNFERWVDRQFNLKVCVWKSDNEPSLHPARGRSGFQVWCEEEGITLELSPSNTHEPNSSAERAVKGIVLKLSKMLNAAGLPEELWTEAGPAAGKLHNITPQQKIGWKTPIHLIKQWVEQRSHLLANELTDDLRPDWNGIYVYGCRAYPLHPSREMNIDRRAFKTSPRGLIGYLVGYDSSNIYRIWVPRLQKVIRTRNVTFNEHIFYSKEEVQTEIEQPERVFDDISLDLTAWEDITEEVDEPNGIQTSEGSEHTAHREEAPILEASKPSGVGPRELLPYEKETELGLQTPSLSPQPEECAQPEEEEGAAEAILPAREGIDDQLGGEDLILQECAPEPEETNPQSSTSSGELVEAPQEPPPAPIQEEGLALTQPVPNRLNPSTRAHANSARARGRGRSRPVVVQPRESSRIKTLVENGKGQKWSRKEGF
ncbi:hypothetical protein S40288_10397 [Stachybotrys chartarum IBT 40288]|nr:hypothetical protein S40288_10397 [Stachybotrys chartarum IBT 40288]